MGKLPTLLPGGTRDNDEEEVSCSPGVPGSVLGAARAPAAVRESALLAKAAVPREDVLAARKASPAALRFPRASREKRSSRDRGYRPIGIAGKIAGIGKPSSSPPERAEWERAEFEIPPESSTSSSRFAPAWTNDTPSDAASRTPDVGGTCLPGESRLSPGLPGEEPDAAHPGRTSRSDGYRPPPESAVHEASAASSFASFLEGKVAGENCTDELGCAAAADSTRRNCVPSRRSVRANFPRRLVNVALLFGILAMTLLCAPLPGAAMPSHDVAEPLERALLEGFENDFGESLQDSDAAGSTLSENELEIIRQSIVQGLGLQRIPDPSKANVSQSEYERAHREYLSRVQQSRSQDEEHGARERRSLHVFHATEHPGNGSHGVAERRRGQYYRHSLFFPVEIPGEDVSVDHASLRLLLDGHPDEHTELDALIYLRMPTRRELIVKKRIELHKPRHSKWLEFDSTDAVAAWLQTNSEHLGLELEFHRNGESVPRSFSSPVLNVFTSSEVSGRRKRSSPEELMPLHKGRRTKCKGESKKCCRHELTVMFKDLKGFEFIVYPKTFDAGYCKGRCPPRYNPAHHHALLQSLLWKEDRKKVPKPCCAPSKLDQLMIVYFDENDATELKVSYWKNIQVLECACS